MQTDRQTGGQTDRHTDIIVEMINYVYKNI